MRLFSASQIKKFRECQRSWAWAYIAKLKTPPGHGALLGTEVDDTQIQPYLRDGRPIDFTRESGYIAQALLEYLPAAKTAGLEIQKHFVLPSPASGGEFAYQGFMDLFHLDSGVFPNAPGGAPGVGDTKTTKNLRYALTEKELATDPQAMLYATQAIVETKAQQVDLIWAYAQTAAPTKEAKRKSKRTYLRVHTEHVLEQFKGIEATALEMHSAHEGGVTPLDLPPTPSQCSAYGGCPYQHLCNLSPNETKPADTLAGLAGKELDMSSGTNSLMAKLAAKKAGAQPPSGADPGQDLASKPAAAPPPPAPEVSLEEHVKENPRAAFLLGGKPTLGINPPEKDQITPAAEPAPAPAAKRGPGRPRKDPKGSDVLAATGEPKQQTLPFVEPAPAAEARPVVVIDYDKLANAIIDMLTARLALTAGGR